MTDAEALTIHLQSFLHGDRVWLRIGERAHGRRNGRQFICAVWQSTCVVCGRRFEVETPATVKAVERSKSFGTVTCPAHRLTPSEVAQLRFAPRDQRHAAFEALKRCKLQNPVAPPAPPAPPAAPALPSRTPVRASPPTTCHPHPLSSPEGRARAEHISKFRAEHRAGQLSAEQIAAAAELREREADDELAARLASFWRPKPPPLPN